MGIPWELSLNIIFETVIINQGVKLSKDIL